MGRGGCGVERRGVVRIETGGKDFSRHRVPRSTLSAGRVDADRRLPISQAGASTGHLSLAVLPVVKHAKFINQDRPEVCAEGEKVQFLSPSCFFTLLTLYFHFPVLFLRARL